jgi:hypothetical protein
MIITAFDPGYVKAGIAQIEVYEDGIFVEHAGLILPAWNAPGKSLEKVDAMIAGLEKYKKDYPQFFKCDSLVVEAQEAYARRRGAPGANANVLIRMGKVSGAFYAMVEAEDKIFVLPKTWNQSRSKEQNHPKIFERLENPDPSTWPWVHKVTASNYEHAVDAVGMALWMFDQTKQGQEHE